MKTVLMLAVVIIGFIIEGKVSRGFIKLMKNKLALEVFGKYRFWIAEGAFLISAVIISIVLCIVGIINGAGSETFYAAPKACLVLFGFFTVFALFRFFIEKQKTPIAKLYDKYHQFTSSEAIHALELNEKEILIEKLETYPTDLREHFSFTMTPKMREKFHANYRYDEIKAKYDGLISKLKSGQPFTEEEVDAINLVMKINMYDDMDLFMRINKYRKSKNDHFTPSGR